jgi:hypothetical protein
MIYIVNPGDMLDVQTFTTAKDAKIALEKAFSADHNFAALYSWSYEQGWCRYERGHWFEVERNNLQVKVIEACHRARGRAA